MLDMPIMIIVLVLVGVIALFVVIKNLRLPESYYKNEQKRSEIRKKIIDHEINQSEK